MANVRKRKKVPFRRGLMNIYTILPYAFLEGRSEKAYRY